MSSRTRLMALVVTAMVVGAIVVFDRAVNVDGADAVSGRVAFNTQAQLVGEMRAVVAAAPEWREAHETLLDRWSEERRRLIVARSAEVATGRLRSRVETILRDLDLELEMWSALPVRAALDEEPIRVIGLSLSFVAPNPDTLFSLLDRLEHLPDHHARVASLSVVGPGHRMGSSLRVSLDLESLAWIEEGA